MSQMQNAEAMGWRLLVAGLMGVLYVLWSKSVLAGLVVGAVLFGVSTLFDRG
jgi:uncharacterized membrane protein (UPF0136 family)